MLTTRSFVFLVYVLLALQAFVFTFLSFTAGNDEQTEEEKEQERENERLLAEELDNSARRMEELGHGPANSELNNGGLEGAGLGVRSTRDR